MLSLNFTHTSTYLLFASTKYMISDAMLSMNTSTTWKQRATAENRSLFYSFRMKYKLAYYCGGCLVQFGGSLNLAHSSESERFVLFFFLFSRLVWTLSWIAHRTKTRRTTERMRRPVFASNKTIWFVSDKNRRQQYDTQFFHMRRRAAEYVWLKIWREKVKL